ncbi:T9SS type A sorting domain-containing protein [Adhaeribacter sp. BT258]|uniref:T9SS type A sorting domain-containing protein n=1 Tax=Adhaeribacter terrigena TaxID=2793070 RepID=A0ABS1BX18_9BACT|nr:T9SS type A sorting domain-containing protein [Adhaeribacter terrigena]MBK0401436.1 T9SS type A sorting domain-containing protein [Adhaeribacter terrigena]
MRKPKKLLVAFLSLFLFVPVAQAQTSNAYTCQTERHAAELENQNPNLITNRQAMEAQIQQYLQQAGSLKTNGVVIKIPVVVHVVSEKGCNSISKAQVLNGLEVVNQDFRRQNPDTINTRAVFKPFAADTEIEFVLARKDPQGNPTDGINRITSPLAHVPATRATLQQAVPAWPTNQYLNIWLVESIYDAQSGMNILGYAQFPHVPPLNIFGVVLEHSQWGKQGAVPGTTASSTGHFATTEIAHCFNLFHIEGINCTDGDLVSDTPPSTFAGPFTSACNLSQNTCTNDVALGFPTDMPDQIENFMSFSSFSCMNMFTNGQKMRMRASLNTYPHLQNMVSPSNALATGIDPSVTVAPLTPKPYFCADTRRICAGNSVTFSDISYQQAASSRTWSFPGGTPATSTVQNPVVTYATPGKYAVTLTLSNGGNTYPVTVTNFIEVVPVSNLINVTFPDYYVESFEEPTFPESATANRNWEMKTSALGANPANWQRTNASSSTGAHSLLLGSASVPEGTISTLITPNFTGGAPYVFFRMAYAKRVAQPKDELRVYASADCGATWGNPIITLTGNQLVTNGGTSVSGNYIPASGDWKTKFISSGGSFQNWGADHTMFKIETVNNGGGTFYFDNFEIGNLLCTNEELASQNKINLYPNPLTAESKLEFELKTSEKVTVKILDLVGKTIYSGSEATFSAGKHSVLLADKVKNQSKGLYLVQLQMGGKVFNTKLLLQ